MVRESMIIESGGGPPLWQLPPLGWVAGRTDAEDGIDPALCPVDDADADLACLVDTHLQPTLPQMISIHPNVLNHVSGRKPKLSCPRRPRCSDMQAGTKCPAGCWHLGAGYWGGRARQRQGQRQGEGQGNGKGTACLSLPGCCPTCRLTACPASASWQPQEQCLCRTAGV